MDELGVASILQGKLWLEDDKAHQLKRDIPLRKLLPGVKGQPNFHLFHNLIIL